MMGALAYEVPQVVVPGRVFERQFNAESVERTRCGLSVRAPKPALIAEAALRLVDEPALTSGIRGTRDELSELGGTERIVREVEQLVDARPEDDWSRHLEARCLRHLGFLNHGSLRYSGLVGTVWRH